MSLTVLRLAMNFVLFNNNSNIEVILIGIPIIILENYLAPILQIFLTLNTDESYKFIIILILL